MEPFREIWCSYWVHSYRYVRGFHGIPLGCVLTIQCIHVAYHMTYYGVMIKSRSSLLNSHTYSSYCLPVSMSWRRAHNRVVVFHTLQEGQRYTRICPYLVQFATFYMLLFSQIWGYSVLITPFSASRMPEPPPPIALSRALMVSPSFSAPPSLIEITSARHRQRQWTFTGRPPTDGIQTIHSHTCQGG